VSSSADTQAGHRLAGKSAIVSGCAQGIGRAILESFIAAGATVIGIDIADQGQAICDAQRPAASFRRMDVTSDEHWADLVRSLVDEPPAVLVNNAGGLLSSATLHEHTPDVWRETLELNLTSVFLAMRSLIPLMLHRGSGSIINVGSVSGRVGQPDAAAYQAAKAGVAMLTRNAAVTYSGYGIRVNTLTPSVVATPSLSSESEERTAAFIARVPLRRPATPVEVSAAAIFLASDESSYVTGADLAVDGGYLA